MLGVALLAFLNELRRPSRLSLVLAAASSGAVTFVRPSYGAFVAVALVVLIARRPAVGWRRDS